MTARPTAIAATIAWYAGIVSAMLGHVHTAAALMLFVVTVATWSWLDQETP